MSPSERRGHASGPWRPVQRADLHNFVLRLRRLGRLPLHVFRLVSPATLQGNNMIFHVARARTARSARGRARVTRLERPSGGREWKCFGCFPREPEGQIWLELKRQPTPAANQTRGAAGASRRANSDGPSVVNGPSREVAQMGKWARPSPLAAGQAPCNWSW